MYFFNVDMLRHDFDWYEAHFAPDDGDEPKPVRGEISPGYSRLTAWQVNRIAKLLPDLRLILTLRHPIERVWSQALLEFGYLEGRDIRKISSIDFLRQVERSHQIVFGLLPHDSDLVQIVWIRCAACGTI
jgi:hypothetical protein